MKKEQDNGNDLYLVFGVFLGLFILLAVINKFAYKKHDSKTNNVSSENNYSLAKPEKLSIKDFCEVVLPGDIKSLEFIIEEMKDYKGYESFVMQTGIIEKDFTDSRALSDSCITQKNKTEKEIIKLYKKGFPKARKIIGEHMKDLLWEYNIDVSTSGIGNSTISFSGITFANNKNIKDYYEKTEIIFKTLRFKKIIYRWSKSSDEYTYYTLKNSSDNHI